MCLPGTGQLAVCCPRLLSDKDERSDSASGPDSGRNPTAGLPNHSKKKKNCPRKHKDGRPSRVSAGVRSLDTVSEDPLGVGERGGVLSQPMNAQLVWDVGIWEGALRPEELAGAKVQIDASVINQICFGSGCEVNTRSFTRDMTSLTVLGSTKPAEYQGVSRVQLL